MSTAEKWAQRRASLAQVEDYYAEQLRLIRLAMIAAAPGREDETDLIAAMLALSDLEGPDIEFEIPVPTEMDPTKRN